MSVYIIYIVAGINTYIYIHTYIHACMHAYIVCVSRYIVTVILAPGAMRSSEGRTCCGVLHQGRSSKWGGFLKHGWFPIAGWLISWKIHQTYGWWLGKTRHVFRKPPLKHECGAASQLVGESLTIYVIFAAGGWCLWEILAVLDAFACPG